MTEELKTVVTIISVLIIVGIFGHGLWSIRKNKEQLRDLKPSKRNEPGLDVQGLDNDNGPLDENGLDSHGVGRPRTIGGSNQQPQQQTHHDESQLQVEPAPQTQSSEDQNEPVIGEEPLSAQNSSPKQESQPKAPESSKAMTEESAAAKGPSEVLIIHVAMPDNQTISGASLLPLLISMGFKFGDMEIFHRHEDNAGNGPVLFSLASMYNPGTFDIDNIEQIAAKGLSLFMTLPGHGEALSNFNMMHNAAKKLAEEFGGNLLDSNRSALTVQTVRHYVEKIREFERQLLING